MNQIWQINADIYLEIYELAVSHGKKAGDSMEEEFREVINRKGIKPIGVTELNQKELIQEYRSHGKNVLDLTNRKE